MAKQPDRWERTAELLSRKEGRLLYPSDVAKLLRKEHREVVRIVQKERNSWHESATMGSIDFTSSVQKEIVLILDDILSKLNERAK